MKTFLLLFIIAVCYVQAFPAELELYTNGQQTAPLCSGVDCIQEGK